MTEGVLKALHPSVYSYIDGARLWLRNPLSEYDLQWLSERAGGRKMHVKNGPARFSHNFVQRVDLYQPSQEALEWLSHRNDVLLNYAEFALDWVLACDEDRQAAFRAAARTLVKRHHRRQGLRFVGDNVEKITLYTGPRTAANVVVIYADKPSKISGEPCVHTEWRAKGVAALRCAEIHSVQDLLTFDHRRFWRDRLILCDIDRRKLGRCYNKWVRKSRRRSPWIIGYGESGFTYDMDLRAGSIIANACGTTQGLIDRCRKHYNVSGCLVRLYDIEHLLPRPP
jgi:hypothetical protein